MTGFTGTFNYLSKHAMANRSGFEEKRNKYNFVVGYLNYRLQRWKRFVKELQVYSVHGL
jgi:hypothetical protein